uniref:Uncharacterized protein n=1 Tax=Candidozyma auris TaxID=498019 RepID=A0A0L0P726_CANAR
MLGKGWQFGNIFGVTAATLQPNFGAIFGGA